MNKKINLEDCNCEVDYNCGIHFEEELYWGEQFRYKPDYRDVDMAYDRDDYKGKHWEGWAT